MGTLFNFNGGTGGNGSHWASYGNPGTPGNTTVTAPATIGPTFGRLFLGGADTGDSNTLTTYGVGGNGTHASANAGQRGLLVIYENTGS